MKLQELKQLIREQVKCILLERDSKKFNEKTQQMIKDFKELNKRLTKYEKWYRNS